MLNLSVEKGAKILLYVAAILMALSTLLIGYDPSLGRVLDFFMLQSEPMNAASSYLAGGSFFALAIMALMSIRNASFERYLGYVLLLVSVVPLITLFDSQRWIASLGGFPAIGSGQGIIKYFALLALGVHFLYRERLSINQQKLVQLLPVLIVLLWIGGMKFTEIEAKGIKDLVETSPLMSWMYQVWSLQMTSNIIGVYDLLAVLFLVLSLRFSQFFWLGFLMAVAVMLTTQTFLFTWPAALSADTILSSGGQFLIKDLWFLANLVLFYQLSKMAKG